MKVVVQWQLAAVSRFQENHSLEDVVTDIRI